MIKTRKLFFSLLIIIIIVTVGAYSRAFFNKNTKQIEQNEFVFSPVKNSVFHTITPLADLSSKRIYHRSQFYNYAPFVNSELEKINGNKKINLEQTLGGVVSHHIPTTIPALADFYAKLKNTRDVKTFIILGPDHIDKSNGDINVSKADFVTPFGTLKPNLEIINKLEQSGFVVNDEAPFDKEHSIDSQTVLISKLFPSARVVPIIFRSSLTNEKARAFGKILSETTDKDMFVVASVDFSHYLSKRRARPIDSLSANVLGALNSNSANLIEADSPQSLTTLMSFLEAKNAKQSSDLQIFNTEDFNNNNDFTTGYIFSFWGTKNKDSERTNLNSESDKTTVLFVGDIMLSRAIGAIMKKQNDYNFPFLKIKDFLSGADLTFGNLESPISDRGIKIGSIYSFRAEPKVLEGLKNAGFDILNIANNHIWDYGEDGFHDTLNYLKNSGIDFIGGGENFGKAHKGALKEVNGTKIIFLGFTDLLPKSAFAGENSAGASRLDMKQVLKDIKEAKKEADIVAVSFHFGEEYQTKHNIKQEKTAKAVIDAGASLVIGHHPHVVQEVENYNNGYIAYSLGNFVFDQNFSRDTQNGLALKVILKNKKIFKVEQIKIAFNSSFQPYAVLNQE